MNDPVSVSTLIKYFALPNPTDEGRFTSDGQPMADWKMQAIKEMCEAFGSSVEGSKMVLESGAQAKFYVILEPDFRDETKMANAISMNHPILPAD